jgi:hypothetical protein
MQSKTPLRSSTARMQKSSASHQNHDPAVVSLDAYRAQRRRAAAAAQADACCRGLIGALISVVVIAGFIASGYTMHRERELQRIERW